MVLLVFVQKREGKMNKNEQKSRQPVDERYGVPVYQTNPSIPAETEIETQLAGTDRNRAKGADRG